MRFRQPWFAIGFAGVLAIGAMVALGSGLPGTAPSAAPTASMPASFQPGPETEPASVAPTASFVASSTPSPGATETSPTAIPGPTLDWANLGYAVGVRDPIAFGGTAKVTITAPVGPVCTLAARYPNGHTAAVGGPTHPKAGTWVWAWTVPGTAGLGKASISFGCSYAGLLKPGTGSFTIVAVLPTATPKPTPSPTWSITGTIDLPVSANNGTLTFHGHVVGDPPPGIAPIDLRCELYLDGDTVHYLARDGSVQAVDFTLSGPVGYLTPGSHHTWQVSCYPTAPGSRSVSGSFDAQ